MVVRAEAICTGSLAGHNSVRYILGVAGLTLPRTLAIGDMISYSNEKMHEKDGDKLRFTFAGSIYFDRMKQRETYTLDKDIIQERIKRVSLLNIYDERLI